MRKAITKASMIPPPAKPSSEAVAMSRSIPSTRQAKVPRLVTTVPVIRGCRVPRLMRPIVKGEGGRGKGKRNVASPVALMPGVSDPLPPPGTGCRNPHNDTDPRTWRERRGQTEWIPWNHVIRSSMAKRSNYQDRIIRKYYENRDEIMLQRLGELVTDLYLAEGKTRARVWKRVGEVLAKLKVSADQIQHLLRSDNPALVANLLKKLLEKPG